MEIETHDMLIREEQQKTVVAFIVGLLIAGLLVWVFTPEQNPVEVKTVIETVERPLNEKWANCYTKAERALGNRNETTWNIWYDFHGVTQEDIEIFMNYCIENY